MEDIVKNLGLQHIIEKSLTLLNIWDIASVKFVNEDFRKIVDCPRFYLMKLSKQENVPKDLIQKWQKLIRVLNDDNVEKELKLELFKMNCPPKNPKYPLQMAYDLLDEKKELELAMFIIENSYQTDYVKAKNGLIGNLTSMHLAAMFGLVETATKMINNNHSNEPNPADFHGITPLMLAAEYGHLNIIQLLMNLTENPNAPRNDGLTPIHCAAYAGCLEIVRLLMNSTTNPNAPNNDGYTPIHHAATKGHLEIVRLLMTTTTIPNAPSNSTGLTPIHIAAMKGHINVIQLLMTATTTPNVPSNTGWTPIHIAATKGHINIIRLLMTATDANPNV